MENVSIHPDMNLILYFPDARVNRKTGERHNSPDSSRRDLVHPLPKPYFWDWRQEFVIVSDGKQVDLGRMPPVAGPREDPPVNGPLCLDNLVVTRQFVSYNIQPAWHVSCL